MARGARAGELSPILIARRSSQAASACAQCVSTQRAVEIPAVGYFHPTIPRQTLVCGSAAEQWYEEVSPAGTIEESLVSLYTNGVQQLYLADDARHCPGFAGATAAFPGNVDTSALAEADLLHELREAAVRTLPTQIIHATMLRVGKLGLLLRGCSGSGKSTLALMLLDRGHALVADDAVELRRLGPCFLLASCPLPLSGFMAVEGLGIVDITRIHGRTAVTDRARLDLVIDLSGADTAPTGNSADQCLHGRWQETRLLNEAIPCIMAPPQHGSLLAPWVLAACAIHQARLEGHDADTLLIAHHRELLAGTAKNQEF